MDDFSSVKLDLDSAKLKPDPQLWIPELHPTIGVVDNEAEFSDEAFMFWFPRQRACAVIST